MSASVETGAATVARRHDRIAAEHLVPRQVPASPPAPSSPASPAPLVPGAEVGSVAPALPRPAPRVGSALREAAGSGSRQALQELLDSVRSHLDMEVAFVSEFTGGRRVFTDVSADGATPVAVGGSDPLEATYCQRVVDGRLPAVTPDAAASPEVAGLPVTGQLGIGAYVGVPGVLPDGSLYGTLCAFRRDGDPTLSPRDGRFLDMIAEIVGRSVARRRADGERSRSTRDALGLVLDSGGPAVALQRVVRLADGATVGHEALARFPALAPPAPQNPAEWFERAAAAGLGEDLEAAAVTRALASLPLSGDARERFLSVNASPALLCSGRFAQLVEGVPLDRLVVEVTEHAVIEDYAPVRAALAPLRARGLRLAVDDAGAGFASLRHVLELAPDVLKLDLSLVRGIDTDPSRQALAAALLAFAGHTGSLTVAEGIETEAELQALCDLGVDLGQGYYLGRPAVPA